MEPVVWASCGCGRTYRPRGTFEERSSKAQAWARKHRRTGK